MFPITSLVMMRKGHENGPMGFRTDVYTGTVVTEILKTGSTSLLSVPMATSPKSILLFDCNTILGATTGHTTLQ